MDKLAVFATIAVAVLAAGVGALAPRGQLAGNSSFGGSHVQVAIADYAFSPNTLTIQVGTTVRWMNMDTVAHTVTLRGHDDMGGGMGSGMLRHMGTYRYTFVEPGMYAYHCDAHPYMIGTVVVHP